MTRRQFSKTVATTVAAASIRSLASPLEALAAESPGTDQIAGLSLTEAANQIRADKITSTTLTLACLERIRIYNPKVDAYITVLAERALAQAAQMDVSRKRANFEARCTASPSRSKTI